MRLEVNKQARHKVLGIVTLRNIFGDTVVVEDAEGRIRVVDIKDFEENILIKSELVGRTIHTDIRLKEIDVNGNALYNQTTVTTTLFEDFYRVLSNDNIEVLVVVNRIETVEESKVVRIKK